MVDIFRLNKKRNMIRMAFLLLGICYTLIVFSGVNSTCVASEPSTVNQDLNLKTTVILRLAHGVKQEHPTNIMSQEVAKEIYAKTNGKIRLEIYDNMQFGQEIELIKMVQHGKLDFAIVSIGALSTFDSAADILELPYLFTSEEQANQALDGEPGQAIFKTLIDSDLLGICFWENGFRSLTTKDRLVKRPEDLNNLHIRVMQNPIYLSFFSKLGAIPTPMAWGEVIPALKSGIIEAQENPIPIICTNNLERYQQYLILTEHIFDPHIVLTSNSLRMKLTPDELNLVCSIFINARIRQRSLVKEQSNSNIKVLKERGMNIIKPEIGDFRRVGREFSKAAIKMFEPGVRLYFERYLR